LNGSLYVLASFLYCLEKLCSFISTQSSSLNSTGLTFQLKYLVDSSIDLSLFSFAI
jgi:hypothetical protein